MGAVLAVEEAKQLLKLCEVGRLYEVEAWIRAGRSLEMMPMCAFRHHVVRRCQARPTPRHGRVAISNSTSLRRRE